MSAIMTAVGTVFTAFFGSTGYVANVINLIVANDFLLVGVALMLAGTAISYLSRLIHS